MNNRRNELSHHGILGMKWGIRRFQNKDGSLTPAGKRRELMNKKSEELAKEADRALSKSKYGRLYSDWKKKNPDADEDDFDDFLVSNNLYVEPTRRYERLRGDANALSKDFVRNQATGVALISSLLAAPLVAKVVYAFTKSGKFAAAAALGTIGGLTMQSVKDASKEQKRVATKYDIE